VRGFELGKRLFWLSTLYVVQGLPYGFQGTALAAYLREAGVSLTELGFLDLLALPWMLKVLWAPAVDRFGNERIGRRRSWILPLQALLALTCACAAFAPPDRALALLLGLIFTANLLAATLDIAVDGLAVDLLDEGKLGLGNTAQVVGFKVGMLLGGGVLVWLAEEAGWSMLFFAMGGCVLAGLVVSLLSREPPSDGVRGEEGAPVLRRLLTALMTWRGLALIFVIGTYKLGEKMADAMYPPFLVDAGYTPGQLGLWLGTWGMGFSMAGSIAGGLLAMRLRLLDALLLTATLRVFPHAAQWWLVTTGEPTETAVISIACAESLFGGALTTVMFAFMMSQVDRRVGASHYTLFAALEVVGKMPAAPIAGITADAHGYAPVFALATLISAGYLFLLVGTRRVLQRRPQEAPQTL